MILVEVLNTPIRYGQFTYFKGDTFEIQDHHFLAHSMKLVGAVDSDQSDFFSLDNPPLKLGKKELEALSLDGLKDYAKEFNIDLGRAKSEEGIIEKILKAQGE